LRRPVPSQRSRIPISRNAASSSLRNDRYGAGRSENTDGARNHTRIAAGLECEQGRYAQGIAEMEALLKHKAFDVPPPPTGLAQSPAR